MARPNTQSARQEQFNLRMPDGMREAVSAAAARNCRSMNSEIVFQLGRIYGADSKTADEREARSAA